MAESGIFNARRVFTKYVRLLVARQAAADDFARKGGGVWRQRSLQDFQPALSIRVEGRGETGFEARRIGQLPAGGSHRSKLQGGRSLCILKSDAHAPYASGRPASDKACGSPLEGSDMSEDFADRRPAAGCLKAP